MIVTMQRMRGSFAGVQGPHTPLAARIHRFGQGHAGATGGLVVGLGPLSRIPGKTPGSALRAVEAPPPGELFGVGAPQVPVGHKGRRSGSVMLHMFRK